MTPAPKLSPETTYLLDQAIAEPRGGIVTSQLQSESPGGLAHSAICALRRGDTPSAAAQASLDATLAWRDAHGRFHTAYSPYHRLLSRWQAAGRDAVEAQSRAVVAQACLDYHGGPLGSLSEHDAAKRLRGAYAQTHSLADTDPAQWRDNLSGALRALRGHIPLQQAVDPAGTRFGDLLLGLDADPEDLPATPIAAAWAAVHGSDGLKRAARRWATAVAGPILERARQAREAHAAAAHEAAATDEAEVIGVDNIEAMLAAADSASAAGVRLSDFQLNQVAHMRSLIAMPGAAIQ